MARQEPFRTSSFPEAACSSSLSTETLDSNNFQDSSLTEETFSKTTPQTAAWQKRASDRQLLREQLGRRDLQKGTFRDSSLEDETFNRAASKQAAWKRHFALAPSKRAALNRAASKRTAWKRAAWKTAAWKTAASKTAASKTAAWKTAASQTTAWQLSLEQPSFQTRTSRTELVQLQRTLTTELSEPERTALHTELAELERPTLTTELAQLKTSSFGESSFYSLKSPASTALLCLELRKESLYSGIWLRTASCQGGVLRSLSSFLSLTLLQDLCLMPPSWLKLRQLTQEKGACSPCSLSTTKKTNKEGLGSGEVALRATSHDP